MHSRDTNFVLSSPHHRSQQVQPPSTLLPGQVAVTQEQFEEIALASVTELWTRFGNLTEIWFDGGYAASLKANLTQLLLHAQPDAVCFGGSGVSPNPVRWCGTEDGHVPGWPTIYSTSCDGDNGAGCPPDSAGATWNPSGEFWADAGLDRVDVFGSTSHAPWSPMCLVYSQLMASGLCTSPATSIAVGVDFTLQTGDHWCVMIQIVILTSNNRPTCGIMPHPCTPMLAGLLLLGHQSTLSPTSSACTITVLARTVFWSSTLRSIARAT